MVNNDSGRQYTMKTDKKGEFAAVNVPVGMYHLTITKDGKVVYEAPGKSIKADTDLKIDLAKERVAAKEQQMQALSRRAAEEDCGRTAGCGERAGQRRQHESVACPGENGQ